MDDILSVLLGHGSRSTPYDDAHWWFLLNPSQKRQHLYVDSEIDNEHIDLILKAYGETFSSLYADGDN